MSYNASSFNKVVGKNEIEKASKGTKRQMKEPRSPHVLNASSNLIGFCFLVVTSLRFLSKATSTVVDELATISMVFFMAASILSFLSLRRASRRALLLERVASGLFLSGLLLLFISTVLFSLRLID